MTRHESLPLQEEERIKDKARKSLLSIGIYLLFAFLKGQISLLRANLEGCAQTTEDEGSESEMHITGRRVAIPSSGPELLNDSIWRSLYSCPIRQL